MTRAAVLYNEDSDLLARGSAEDRIAWNGAARVAREVEGALKRRGFEVLGVSCGRTGLAPLVAQLREGRPDIVFNLCESFAGESRHESAVASLLEMLRIPFTGNDPLALALARDKARCKELLQSCGFPVADWRVFTCNRPAPDLTGLQLPLIVKPRCEDASHGLSASSVCTTLEEALSSAAKAAAVWRQDFLIEEFLPGREFNIGVLFDGTVLAPSEIDYQLPEGCPHLVTYEAKWVEDSVYYRGTPVRCPAENAPAMLERLALNAWRVLGCRDYARIDIRLDAEDEPRILEVNPNPDLAPDSGLARAAAASGLAYDDLIERIARRALERVQHPGA